MMDQDGSSSHLGHLPIWVTSVLYLCFKMCHYVFVTCVIYANYDILLKAKVSHRYKYCNAHGCATRKKTNQAGEERL